MQNVSRFRGFRRALFGCGAVIFVGSVVIGIAPGAAPAASAADGQVTVEVSMAKDLLDGQAIEVEVTAPSGQKLLPIAGTAKVCRDGATYTSEADLQFAAGNCPDVSISSSGSVANHAGLFIRPDLGSAVGTYRIGVGAVEWSRGPVTHRLTCDTANPCRLVVVLRTSSGAAIVDSSTLLTFADSSALASCGGSAEDAIDTAGPDRFIDTWARWTRSQCEATKGKASTTAVFAGEGLGLDAFAAGTVDLAYSATGATIPGRPMKAKRPSISIPIGVNATVLALVGGYPDRGATDWPIGLRRPYTDVRVTPSELAALFGQGVHGFMATGSDEAVIRRSPQLADVSGVAGPVQAPASSDATTFFATRWFDARAGDVWLSSPIQDPPSEPRGIVDELSAATPAFARWSMDMYSSRATLKKVVADDANRTLEYNLTWVLTDLATAEQLGLPVAELQNSRGEFVAPTTESLQAALTSVTPAADGTVLPGTGGDRAGAYPLAFVEHAVVPADPDCEGTGHERTVRWVEHLTGDGQAGLVGVRPLEGDLAEASATSAARFAEACDAEDADPTDPPGPTPATPVAPGDTPGVPGGPDGFGSLPEGGFGTGGPDLPGTAAGDVGSTDAGTDDEDEAETAADERAARGREEVAAAADRNLPPLAGSSGTRATAGLGALIGLAFMGAGVGSLGKGGRLGIPAAGR